MEIIEYKSDGHPDTLTDIVVENCASFLDDYYMKKYDRVMHYNVDKALFLAGDMDISFTDYTVNKAPCFILGGQVSMMDEDMIHGLKSVIRHTIGSKLPGMPFTVEIRCNNISDNLGQIASNVDILANDTSFGVGYYPLSNAELTVKNIIEKMYSWINLQKYPLGLSFKVMYTPATISISCPLLVGKVKNMEEYGDVVRAIEKDLSVYGEVVFNPDFRTGHPYLSVYGSSIECGDDGQVGRGNRYNGLITPCRPMTLEAYHGKNNRNHVGKLYQKRAYELAKKFYENTGVPVEVYLVSKIGLPVEAFEIYTKYNYGK